MAYDYDKLYRDTPDALGAPTGVFVDFFQRLEERAHRVLDIGCGQGRDAVFIARLGHRVTGVDLSPHGIRDLRQVAKAEGLAITGVVADIRSYVPDGQFDIILIDRTLHMLAAQERGDVLDRLLDHAGQRGQVLIADEPANIPALRKTIDAHPGRWTVSRQDRGYLFAQRGD